MASKPRKPLAHNLHQPAAHPKLLGFFTAAAGALAVASLHVLTLVGDAGGAPMAAGSVGPLASSRCRRVLIAEPVPHCARITFLEAALGAKEADEVRA